jgi:hypothetical protein
VASRRRIRFCSCSRPSHGTCEHVLFPILYRVTLCCCGKLSAPTRRLLHDGPGLATTPAARGATTEAILQKMQRLACVPGFVIGTASPVQRPPAARLCPASPDRGSHQAPGRQAAFARTCDRRAAPGWRRSPNRWDRHAREHGADDAAELAFHVNKIPISVAIEGRGAEEMVGWCCVGIGPIRALHLYIGGNRRWTC